MFENVVQLALGALAELNLLVLCIGHKLVSSAVQEPHGSNAGHHQSRGITLKYQERSHSKSEYASYPIPKAA